MVDCGCQALQPVASRPLGRGLDAVVVDRRHLARAQPAFVHEAEVRHVEEVLDQARRAGLHLVGAAVELAQACVVPRPRRPAARLALACRAAPRPGRGPRAPHAPCARCVAGGTKSGSAGTCTQLAAGRRSASRGTGIRALRRLRRHHAAQRKLRAAVRAAVGPGLHRARGVAPQHQACRRAGAPPAAHRATSSASATGCQSCLSIIVRLETKKGCPAGQPLRTREPSGAYFLSPPGTLPSTPLT